MDLSAQVLTELARRTGVDPELVDDVVWGCVSQIGDQSSNVARFAALAAGWPERIPGTTINRACGSSQQALDFAAHAVMCRRVRTSSCAGGVEIDEPRAAGRGAHGRHAVRAHASWPATATSRSTRASALS